MSDDKFDIQKLPEIPSVEVLPKDGTGIRPHYPAAYPTAHGYGYGYGEDDQKKLLREMWRVMRKRKYLIASVTLIVTTLVAIEMYRTKDTFKASVMVEVGREGTLLRGPDGFFADDYDPYYIINIRTKILSVKSRALLEQAVIEEKLYQNPRFLEGAGKKSVAEAIGLIGARLGLVPAQADEGPEGAGAIQPVLFAGNPQSRTPEEKRLLDQCVAVLQGGINVDIVRDTRALSISFTHTDSETAANVANAVATTLLNRNFDTKTQKFTSAARWLDESTRKLQAKVRDAEEALAAYTRERGIFTTDDNNTLTTSKLVRLHEEALRAETDRVLKESLYQEVRQGRVAEIPEAYAGKYAPKVGELQRELGQLETQYAELGVKFGPEHPRMLEIKEKMGVLREQVMGSRKSLEETLRNEYERSARDEKNLKMLLAQAKGEAVQQNQDAIQYNILKKEVETNKALYQDFLQRTNQAQAQVAEQENNMRLIEPAQGGGLIGPRRFSSIMIALFLSTAAGIGLAFFLNYLDNTIKTVEDVGRYAQLPALSVIPAMIDGPSRRKAIAPPPAEGALVKNSPMLITFDANSSAAEAYRVLRTSVLLSAAGEPPKTILVTSGQPGEGKTTTVVNTAISLAQLGANVLIIDCDLRRPSTHKMFGLDYSRGLSTVLARNAPVEEVIQKLPVPNLSLLPCGPIPPNPAELIISEKMKSLLRELGERYDHILVDSPPLMNVTDPVILSTMVDGVILVVHGGKSTRDIVRRARQELGSVGAKVFGVVLNNVDLRHEGYDDYYYYRYNNAYNQDGVDAGRR